MSDHGLIIVCLAILHVATLIHLHCLEKRIVRMFDQWRQS
jgi:hypothetical protein